MKRVSYVLALLLTGPGCSGKAASGGTASPAKDASLYVRLGGVETLRLLVDDWMLQVSSDERIRDYFALSDMAILKQRLLERICVLVDGPCVYRGRELYEAHAELQLEDRHLTAFMDGLESAIERSKIDGELAQELRDRIRALAAELAIAVGN